MATSTTTTTATPAARRPAARQPSPTIAPRVDIYETDETFVLLADMPGVAPDGLEIVAERDTLTIRGRVNRPERPPEYSEFDLADYYRVFTLTEDLEMDDTPATLNDGVLRLEIGKSKRVQPRTIPVRTE
jgi:HSP20 family molecular chaperone IbpA